MTPPFDVIFVFVVGLAFGSFLNVCIYRLPRSESLIVPASHCPACGRPLAWYENVPVAGYLVLRGRCRTCKARISLVYPLVEVVTGLLFVGSYEHFGVSLVMISRLGFACAMLVLFVIDLEHRILPNLITLPGMAIGFILSFATEPGWVASLVGLVAGGGVLWLVAEAYYRVRGEEGLGMGDVKMLAMVGAFLGWKLMLLTLVLGSSAGSTVGLAMILVKRGTMKYALPFGTFLAIGAVIASVVGDQMVDWYLSFY